MQVLRWLVLGVYGLAAASIALRILPLSCAALLPLSGLPVSVPVMPTVPHPTSQTGPHWPYAALALQCHMHHMHAPLRLACCSAIVTWYYILCTSPGTHASNLPSAHSACSKLLSSCCPCRPGAC